mmetsp:Transcript_29496/g.63149  ORF Transcript_29496/g.63149 Transcript_29496/m.63149 type:complete len:354 (-) Transcript_29496:94-1155(-)
MALHANYALRNLTLSDKEEDYDSDDSRHPREQQSALEIILDKVPETCMVFINGGGDDDDDLSLSSDDDDEYHDHSDVKPRRARKQKEKEDFYEYTSADDSSKNCINCRDVQTEISVTSSSKESSKDDDSISSDDSSKKKVSSRAESFKERNLSKWRRRKQQFLRRRAMERVAADADEDATVDLPPAYGPRLMRKDPIPLQQLRSNVITPNAGDLAADGKMNSDGFGSDGSKTEKTEGNGRSDVAVETHSDDAHSTNSVKTSNTREAMKLKWQSMEKKIQLPPNPVYSFLTSSHLGPVVTRSVGVVGDGDLLQLGDVLIRLNGEDVSCLEGEIVSEIFKQMAGKCVRVSFLRRT